MKNLKHWLIALAFLLPALAEAQVPYSSGSAGSISAGVTIAGTNGTTETLPSATDTLAGLGTTQTFTGVDGFSGGIATNAQAFTSAPTKNPILLQTFSSQPIASANAVEVLVSGVTGRAIVPTSFTLMAGGGAAATCTGIKVTCTPTAGTLATILIASLTSGVPLGTYSSGTVLSNVFASGCAAGDSLNISAYGAACATATFTNALVSYTVQ